MDAEIPVLIAELERRFSKVIHHRNAELVRVDTPETPFWYLNVFIGLAQETMKMQWHLRRAYGEGEVNYCAWAARNLLELRIWTHYATASHDNAWRFHQDQFADGLSLLRALEHSAKKAPREVDSAFLRQVAAVLRPMIKDHAQRPASLRNRPS